MPEFKKEELARDENKFKDPAEYGLKPLEAIDIRQINDFDELLQAMALTSFGGRNVGEAAEVLTEMFADDTCKRVLTITGAMTVGKMTLLIVELLERGLVDAIITTGALQAHGMIEGMGLNHYKLAPESPKELHNDAHLAEIGFNRVTDTIELESNFLEAEPVVDEALRALYEGVAQEQLPVTVGGADVMRSLGRVLEKRYPGNRSILSTALRKDVPVLYRPGRTPNSSSRQRSRTTSLSWRVDLAVYKSAAAGTGGSIKICLPSTRGRLES